MGLPIIIHEQNSVLGRVNRLFAKSAKFVACGFDRLDRLPLAAEDRKRVVGNPVRNPIKAVRDRPYPELTDTGPINILVTGGSQGARLFGEVIPTAIASLPDEQRARLTLVQQAREEQLEAVRAAYRGRGGEGDGGSVLLRHAGPARGGTPRHCARRRLDGDGAGGRGAAGDPDPSRHRHGRPSDGECRRHGDGRGGRCRSGAEIHGGNACPAAAGAYFQRWRAAGPGESVLAAWQAQRGARTRRPCRAGGWREGERAVGQGRQLSQSCLSSSSPFHFSIWSARPCSPQS